GWENPDRGTARLFSRCVIFRHTRLLYEKLTESSIFRGILTSKKESIIVVGLPVVMLTPLSKQKSVQKTLLRLSARRVFCLWCEISLCIPRARATRYAMPIML